LEALLRVSNVTKKFGLVRALDGVSLDVFEAFSGLMVLVRLH
jgi:ABC-type sugar transport system ATPase subunit